MKVFLHVFALGILMCALSSRSATAQDTLPNFSVEKKGNGRVIISWSNPYPNLIQLAVQRSYDSLRRFGTVYSTTSPQLPINGFSDNVVEGLTVFYRIFYVMEGGAYFFTQSKRPAISDDIAVTQTNLNREQLSVDLANITQAKTQTELKKEIEDPNKPLFYRVGDSTDFKIVLLKDFRHFRDSIVSQTRDTLFQTSTDTLWIKLYDPPFAEKASKFIFTDKDGYIVIKLDDADKKKYMVSIMEEDETPIIEIKQLKDNYLILDKTNFYKAGWYKFVIKENGRIKEKGKVFLAKDFSP